MSTDLHSSMLNKLYHDFVKNPSPQNKAKYNKLKKFCKTHIEKSKARYYKKYFEEHKGNSKKQWQMINTLLNRDNKSTKISKLIDSAGKVTNTPIDIANCFNNYFVNVASNLKRESTPDSNPDFYRSYLRNPAPNSIYLRSVEESEVFDVIKNFKNKSTCDTKMSALKIAAESPRFIAALTSIINKSFLDGVFPDKLKIAKVIALHKGGSKTDVSNYRPISLLSSFSKVFEKLMHHRLLDFLQSNGSLYDSQYGFIPRLSCEQALIDLKITYLITYLKNRLAYYYS